MSKNILIVDIGNTCIKVGVFNQPLKPVKEDWVYSKKVSLDFFKEFIGRTHIDECYIGSVAPSKNKEVVKYIKNLTGSNPVFLNNLMFAKVFDLSNFDNVNEVGIDILGFAYYLQHQYKKVIGICYGTALFAVGVNNKKIYGVILAPLIEIGIRKLIQKAELIDKNKDYKCDIKTFDFGLNTQDAFNSGMNHIYYGFTTNVMNYFYDKYQISTLCITGGNKDKINMNKKQAKNFHIDWVDNAVLKGYSLLVFDK